MSVLVEQGDCREVIARLVAEGVVVDAIVTDPPYGLEFMGKEWDAPWGVGRTSNPGIGERQTEWVSNAGWNASRCANCNHLFHGGSPCRCETPQPIHADNRWHLFQAWNETWARACFDILRPGGFLVAFGGTRTHHRMVCAIEDAGFVVQDTIAWLYGTGFPKHRSHLKPAFEPICVAYKPGGKRMMQIDESRVPSEPIRRTRNTALGLMNDDLWLPHPGIFENHPAGRWPANVCHDGSDEVLAAFPESKGQQGDLTGQEPSKTFSGVSSGPTGRYSFRRRDEPGMRREATSAARFFFSAKADKDDRWGSRHPTVKPVELIRWLVQLVTPPGGLVLDPFAGSGTAGVAALAAGRNAILIEQDEGYVADIRERLAHYEGDGRHSLASKNRNRRETVGTLL